MKELLTIVSVIMSVMTVGCGMMLHPNRDVRYRSDPNHYPYYQPIGEEQPMEQDPTWLKGPRYLSGTSASIYDGTPYRDGGVRMGNTINYPDGRVEFVRP